MKRRKNIIHGPFLLENAGFKTGEYVEVEIDGDKIILSKPAALETKESLDEKIQKTEQKPKRKVG